MLFRIVQLPVNPAHEEGEDPVDPGQIPPDRGIEVHAGRIAKLILQPRHPGPKPTDVRPGGGQILLDGEAQGDVAAAAVGDPLLDRLRAGLILHRCGRDNSRDERQFGEKPCRSVKRVDLPHPFQQGIELGDEGGGLLGNLPENTPGKIPKR